jgi:hypothetical protein
MEGHSPMKRDYRLFIDERGNHHMTEIATEGNRRLTLVGAIVELGSYESTFIPALRDIKRRHFSSDVDTPVVLHWEDVLQRNGIFSVLEEDADRDKFNRDIVSFYASQGYRLVAVVIDKVEHRKRYGSAAQHPYHYCAEVLLERYCMFLRRVKGAGDVYAESRGKNREDVVLQEAFREFCTDGTSYISSEQICSVLSNKEIQFRTKQENVYGLQLCDMLAHCCENDVLKTYGHAKDFKSAFMRRVSAAIATKYRRNQSGDPRGWGQILLSAEKTATPKQASTGRATTPEGAVR